jgi:hypothetical protein
MHRQAHRHTLDQWDKRATVEIAKPADPATSQHKHTERKEGLFASSLLSFLHKQKVILSSQTKSKDNSSQTKSKDNITIACIYHSNSAAVSDTPWNTA